jgi:hypothetical protein
MIGHRYFLNVEKEEGEEERNNEWREREREMGVALS